MPEGDTVWYAAKRLQQALAGHRLEVAELRVPQHATADVAGCVVSQVRSRGKHLLIRIAPDMTVHTHLGMEGSWRVRNRHSNDSSRRWSPRSTVRVLLGTSTCWAIGDRLARVDLVSTCDEDSLVGHLGPDLLDPDFDAEEALRRLRQASNRAIGDAVLDQSVLAGIGNLYRAELLFLRGLHPRTPVGEITDLPGLVRLARRLLWVNRERPEQTTTGDLRRGRSHWVYGRAGEPCRRCATRIEREYSGSTNAERLTFWCPHCQPRSDPGGRE